MSTLSTQTRVIGHWIGGAHRASTSGRTAPVYNPATGAVQAEVALADQAEIDEASRARLAGIYQSSISELEAGLAPELVEELERLSLPFSSDTPSESELRIAQAQLVGWLEGLFHGIQTAIYAQQVAARAQLEQMRRALPPGVMPDDHGPQHGRPGVPAPGEEPGTRGGMYL